VATVADRRFLTPPQIAERFGVSADKVLAWIHSGELRAVNVAEQLGGQRPRWRVSIADLLAFEERRAAVPPPARMQRRKQPAEVIEFF